MSKKIIEVPVKRDDNDEMLALEDWDWSEFKTLYDTVAPERGEEAAWKMIYAIWQLRAGEDVSENELVFK